MRTKVAVSREGGHCAMYMAREQFRRPVRNASRLRAVGRESRVTVTNASMDPAICGAATRLNTSHFTAIQACASSSLFSEYLELFGYTSKDL